jgi:hypothetical protein
MAVIDPLTQIRVLHDEGSAERFLLFAVKGVTAGDTLNLNGYFRVVKRAVALSATADHSGAITTIANTTVTIPTGPAADGILLLVAGVAI